MKFRLGALILVGFPLVGAVGFFVLFPGYWWLGVLAIIGVLSVLGTMRDNHETKLEIQQSAIIAAQMGRRDDRTKILQQIGSPECPDGTYSPRQVALWQKYNAMEKADQKHRKREVETLIKR